MMKLNQLEFSDSWRSRYVIVVQLTDYSRHQHNTSIMNALNLFKEYYLGFIVQSPQFIAEQFENKIYRFIIYILYVFIVL